VLFEIEQSVKASHLANSADEDAAPSFAECSAGGGASIASSPSGTDDVIGRGTCH